MNPCSPSSSLCWLTSLDSAFRCSSRANSCSTKQVCTPETMICKAHSSDHLRFILQDGYRRSQFGVFEVGEYQGKYLLIAPELEF